MTRKPKEQPRLERRLLVDFVPFPKQEQFFDPLPEKDLEELGRAMRKRRPRPGRSGGEVRQSGEVPLHPRSRPEATGRPEPQRN
jgi:hypothetical protein